MAHIIEIHSAKASSADGMLIDFDLTLDLDGEETRTWYTFSPDDTAPVALDLAAFILANPTYPVAAYVPPTEPEPADPLTRDLPRREFRRALLHNGMGTSAVLDVIGAIADPEEREEMQIWWEDTTMFQRGHPALVSMVAAAGLTPAEGDAIWTYGAGLVDGIN